MPGETSKQQLQLTAEQNALMVSLLITIRKRTYENKFSFDAGKKEPESPLVFTPTSLPAEKLEEIYREAKERAKDVASLENYEKLVNAFSQYTKKYDDLDLELIAKKMASIDDLDPDPVAKKLSSIIERTVDQNIKVVPNTSELEKFVKVFGLFIACDSKGPQINKARFVGMEFTWELIDRPLKDVKYAGDGLIPAFLKYNEKAVIPRNGNMLLYDGEIQAALRVLGFVGDLTVEVCSFEQLDKHLPEIMERKKEEKDTYHVPFLLNHRNDHWILAVFVIDPVKKHMAIDITDSFKHSSHLVKEGEIKTALTSAIKGFTKNYRLAINPINFTNIQENGWACGYHAIFMVTTLYCNQLKTSDVLAKLCACSEGDSEAIRNVIVKIVLTANKQTNKFDTIDTFIAHLPKEEKLEDLTELIAQYEIAETYNRARVNKPTRNVVSDRKALEDYTGAYNSYTKTIQFVKLKDRNGRRLQRTNALMTGLFDPSVKSVNKEQLTRFKNSLMEKRVNEPNIQEDIVAALTAYQKKLIGKNRKANVAELISALQPTLSPIQIAKELTDARNKAWKADVENNNTSFFQRKIPESRYLQLLDRLHTNVIAIFTEEEIQNPESIKNQWVAFSELLDRIKDRFKVFATYLPSLEVDILYFAGDAPISDKYKRLEELTVEIAKLSKVFLDLNDSTLNALIEAYEREVGDLKVYHAQSYQTQLALSDLDIYCHKVASTAMTHLTRQMDDGRIVNDKYDLIHTDLHTVAKVKELSYEGQAYYDHISKHALTACDEILSTIASKFPDFAQLGYKKLKISYNAKKEGFDLLIPIEYIDRGFKILNLKITLYPEVKYFQVNWPQPHVKPDSAHKLSRR